MAYCFASVVPALRQKNITTRRPKKKEKAKGNKSGGVVGKERREKKTQSAVQPYKPSSWRTKREEETSSKF